MSDNFIGNENIDLSNAVMAYDEENLKKKFGQLMTRFAIVQSIIKDYDDECKAIQKEIDDLMKGVIDGKSVQ